MALAFEMKRSVEVVQVLYEYQFGVFVEAESGQAAWEKVGPVSEALDKLDVEGKSTVDGPFPVRGD